MQDLLDCVIPIVNESIKQLPTGQVVLSDLQKIVQTRFSFRMPTYSLEHVLGRLAQQGKVTYEKDLKAYYHTGADLGEGILGEASADDKIATLEAALAEYAKARFDIHRPPFFSEWADILVYFLHPDTMTASSSATQIKGAFIADFDDIIRKIASTFILKCEAQDDRVLYEILIEVYGGILLSDFLQNIQMTGNPSSFKSLTVFYDTMILLRLLGCSGPVLGKANIEMHEDLQSLGCKTEYLQNVEKEVINILDTIVARYDAGLSIFGETGEALSDINSGVNIGILRELRESYAESLARMGIFASKYTFQNTRTQNFFQIDETKFEELLQSESATGYSDQNRASDAQSLAVVMRLRQGTRANDLANSKFVLVTANSHFAKTARKFVRMEELGFTSRYVPPILTHSQTSIAAWLTSETKLTESVISRELLSNCMSAQQLSREWVDGFIEIMKGASLPEDDKTIMYAVRSIARDQSLGNPTILRRLNPNEIIRMARKAEEDRIEDLREEHARDVESRLEENTRRVLQEERDVVRTQSRHRADRLAKTTVGMVEVIVMVGCVYVVLAGMDNFNYLEYSSWLQAGGFAVVTVLAMLDLFGFRPIHRIMKPLRIRISNGIFRLFYGEEG